MSKVGTQTRVVVTGGSGFIGSSVVREALSAGHPVAALIRECEPAMDLPGLTNHVVDWGDGAGLAALLSALQPDVIVHCAGSSARGQESPAAIYEANVAIVWTLLSAVSSACPACGVVLLSSAAVYGPGPKTPTAESAQLDPRTHYAHSKVAAEGVARAFAVTDGVRAVVARPFNVLGPGEPSGSVIERIVRQVAEGQGPIVRVHLREASSIRDFVDVADVARALLLIGIAGEAGGVYNICSGVGVSIAEQVRRAAAVRGLSAEMELEMPEEPPSISIGDPGRLMSLGWAPLLAPEESLRRIMVSISEMESRPSKPSNEERA